jgi:hypothetical protein
VDRFKTALSVFDALFYAKGEARRARRIMESMHVGTHEILDTAEGIGRIVEGTFDREDALTFTIRAYNFAPIFKPELEEKLAWRIRK